MKMQCNGSENPIGVSREQIRLSFSVDGSIAIRSYEIQISSSYVNLKKRLYDIGTFSGDIKKGFTLWVQPELVKARTRYYWQVEMQTDQGCKISETAWFETGIDTWKAQWITGYAEKREIQNFCQNFKLDGQIDKARLYICGLGYFRAACNERALDDSYYQPLVTDYAPRHQQGTKGLYKSTDNRITYYTYDILPFLHQGDNTLSIDLANGYYCNTDKLPFEPNFTYGTPQLIYELYIEQEFW